MFETTEYRLLHFVESLCVIPPNANAHRSVTTCHSNTHAMTFINYSLDVIETDVQINRPGYWPFAKNYGHSSRYAYSEAELYVILLWSRDIFPSKERCSIPDIFIKIYLPYKYNTSVCGMKRIKKTHAWVPHAYP